MKQKEKELLQLLVRHQGEYISSKYLAQTLSLSDRTVREYIKRLKVHTVGNGATIYAKAGVGYQFSVTQRVAFEQFYAPIDLLLTKDECESATSSERAERIAYILNKLLIEDETVEIEVMAEEMYLSRSSVSKILADIRRIIIPYELILQRMSFGGYCIVGTERHKRHLIMDYFYSQLPVTMIQQYIEPQLLFQDIRFEELTIIVLDECREGNLRLSDIIIQNLVLHLALSIKRIHAHLEMKELEEGVKERACEYEVAARIMRRVERVLSLRVPQAEIAYLALHLMAKSNNDHPLMDGRLACEDRKSVV